MEVLQEGGPLWPHFSIQASCNLCEETIKIEWGVFSILVTHLKQKHSKIIESEDDHNSDVVNSKLVQTKDEQQGKKLKHYTINPEDKTKITCNNI